jgi:hypothetical protein
MPAVQVALVGPNALTLIQLKDCLGTHTLLTSAIPNTLTLAADIEAWIAANWSNQFTIYFVAVHVMTVSPLTVAVWIGDAGTTPPANWWLNI